MFNEYNYFFTKITEEASKNNTKNIFIFSHRKHDCDAKGAALALVAYFKNKGYNSKYIITSEDYLMINIFGKVEVTDNIRDNNFIAISVDTSTQKISENSLYLNALKSFKIDHHKDSEKFCDYNLIDPKLSSTCEIISSIMNEEDITNEIAKCLYTGIFTDTGGFHYNTTENTFLQIAKLIRNGANQNFINRKLTEVSSKRKKIEGLVYTHHKFFSKDLVGSIIHDCKYYDPLSVARAVNGLTNIDAKVFVVFAKSNTTKEIFVEIRSSTDTNIDVSKIAKKYGGGGSIHASGFTLKNSNIINSLIKELENLII